MPVPRSSMHGPYLELSPELLERLDLLAERLQRTPLGAHLRMTREIVARLALIHGLESLERPFEP